MVGIELRGLEKRFGAVEAVQGLSLTVKRGELLALVGPSGCGKTTLLRMIAGFERPNRGDILFDGRSVLRDEPEQRRVGIVFQDYALFPHMTVARNIAYGLRFQTGMDKSSRASRVEELLSMVGLSGYGGRAPHELSAGQQQRVALARALAPSPNVLLLDEPMSALDALLREELRAQVKEVQKRLGITTVHVTHDQEEAVAIADRVAVLHDGRLEQVGRADEIYFRPRTDFVARFVGRGNLLTGRVAESGGRKVIVELDGRNRIEVPTSVPGHQPGAGVSLLVRPDRISAEGIGTTRIRGRIDGVEFLGEVSRLRVSLTRELLLVLIDSSRAEQWRARVGEEIELGLDARDLWIIPGRESEEEA